MCSWISVCCGWLSLQLSCWRLHAAVPCRHGDVVVMVMMLCRLSESTVSQIQVDTRSAQWHTRSPRWHPRFNLLHRSRIHSGCQGRRRHGYSRYTIPRRQCFAFLYNVELEVFCESSVKVTIKWRRCCGSVRHYPPDCWPSVLACQWKQFWSSSNPIFVKSFFGRRFRCDQERQFAYVGRR